MSAIFRHGLVCCLACVTCCGAAAASASTTVLPGTPAGKLAAELIRHVDTDSPTKIRDWASGVLSPAVARDERADFVDGLVSAARDGGGLEVFDVRIDPHQPDLLQVAVKARRGGRRGLLLLAADPARPGRLGQADLVPMEDPALYAGWPTGAVSHAELRWLIHATLDRLVRTEDFSGCLSVEDGGATVFDECRGLAERRFGVPLDGQTKFRVASIDKMFTAVAIAQLVEAGKLAWDDTLAKLIPEYPDRAAGKITVWQLLHHTSGLGDYLVPAYFRHRERFVDPADYLGLIARQPRLGKPGGDWNYSNAGYVLLGRIVEKASGEGYFDYVRRHVFVPAGMDASGFDSLQDVTPKLAVGYFRDGAFSSDWKADWMKVIFHGSPDGCGYSTNADLLRFARALREGRLVKPATLAKMFDGEVPAGPGAYAAGFGDRVSHGRHIRGHAGGDAGTTANLQMVWETGAAVALTSNQGPSEHWMLAERIADLLAAEDASPRVAGVPARSP